MFAAHKFSIKGNSITIYPLNYLFLTGILFLIVFLILGVAILFLASAAAQEPLEFKTLTIYIFSLLIFTSPFFICSNQRIIIDLYGGGVIKDYVLFKRKIAHLDDIAIIKQIETTSGVMFTLAPKDDTYSKGYKLIEFSRKQHKSMDHFCKIIIPPLEARINWPAEERTAVTDFNWYNRNNNVYSIKQRLKIYQPIMILVFLSAWVWGVFFSNVGWWIWFTLIPIVVYTLVLARKVVIDKNTNEMQTMYFKNLFLRKYPLEKYCGVEIIYNSSSPFAEGTAVFAKFDYGEHTKRVIMRDFGKTKAIDRFMRETETILGNWTTE